MKNVHKKFISLCISLIVLIFLCGFLITKDKDFSENENRFLQKLPKFSISALFGGKYIPKLEEYFVDQFPLRDFFMNIKTGYVKLLGKKDINGVFLAKKDYLIERYNKPVNNDKIIEVLNNFYTDLSYVNMNLMLVPTSITINNNLLPKTAYVYNQAMELEYIYDRVNFTKIKLLDTFLGENKKYQLFYKLDHHWTSYGAYYAYVEYCKNNDIDYLDIMDFEIEEVTNDFKGTLYSKSSDYSRKADSIYLFMPPVHNYEVEYVSKKLKTDTLYEMSYLDKKDKYSLFLDNNHPLIVINNKDVNNGKELVVIKDSYANSMIPFLVNHFSKVHVIDPRFYNLSISDYIRDNQNIRDVLFLYNMNTLDNDLGIISVR